MFDSKFKFSVILCSALLLASCGGGGVVQFHNVMVT